MPLNDDQNRQVASLANLLIENLGAVEAAADRELGQRPSGPAGDVFAAATNPMVGPNRAGHHIDAIQNARRQDLYRIRTEPFVAYVLVESEGGKRQRYFFARGTPPSGASTHSGLLANYRAPVGRLAECPVGESIAITLPARQVTYTVIERALLRPGRKAQGWDGFDDQIEGPDLLIEIDSLRGFLDQLAAPVAPEDYVTAILTEVEAAGAIREERRRGVIQRMSLRDRPILDRYQGEIFRLPLNGRLILSGPPGTGKTTTLIRRLAQKRSASEISEDERNLIPEDQHPRFFHPNNWLMFTPTELLRQYLKEAFAKEGVASSDDRIRTWVEHRRRLGRDVFRILRSEQGGRYILDGESDTLVDPTSRGLVELVDAFSAYCEQRTVERYQEAFATLEKVDDGALATLVGRIRRRAGEPRVLQDRLFDLVNFHEELREHVRRLAESANAVVHGALNGLLARRRDFLPQLSDFLQTIAPDIAEDDEDDDSSAEEEESAAQRDPRVAAIGAFRRALYSRARALYEGRSGTRSGQSGQILAWLGNDVPDDSVLRPLGATLRTLRGVRFLATTHQNLVDAVPALYQRFRRLALREGKWYRPVARTAAERGRVCGAELDAMLLVMLRHARRFLTLGGGRWLREDTRVGMLENVKAEYVTQVLIDEATDFSPVELAGMLELAHPQFRSCFMSGDVLQRVTPWGVQDLTELKWVASDCEARDVEIGYRMSRRLLELARTVARLRGGRVPALKLPDNVEDANVPPLLGENLQKGDLAQWLCDRIREIERNLGSVPSIAIFVDGDDQIDPLLETVRPLLAEHNIEVVGCKEGRVVGVESQVRIFDIQYVKGLEFEAVFFVSVNALIERYRELYDKFLFVGITRAATYLGVTCEGALPAELDTLRYHFSTGDWA